MTVDVAPYTAEDDLIESAQQKRLACKMFYVPSFSQVVLGRGSKIDLELNLETCAELKIPIFRRRGGGCAVLLDPGNVVVAFAAPTSGIGKIKEKFASLSNWIIEGLAQIGISGVRHDGISDFVLDGRKNRGLLSLPD